MGRPRVIAPTRCRLGEGPLWHPERGELIWFDIPERAMFQCGAEGGNLRRRALPEAFSAAAWIDRRRILAASQSGLWRLDLDGEACERLWPLEADDPVTRANDGRADPWGNFWIGTMGWKFERGAGAIWRVGAEGPRLWRKGVTVPNSICFSPDGRAAYWTDTVEQIIWRQPLDPADGAPRGECEVFVDLRGKAWPDGSVCDAEGHVWNAQWDAWRVVRYAPDGREERVVELPIQRPTCPAFGGPDLRRLFVVSARAGLSEAQLAAQPDAGAVFAIDLEDVRGAPEARFLHAPRG